MDYMTASVFQGGHLTSYHALKQRAQLRKGETLLVLGAAGGVGTAAVQLGKAMGARVIAAASTPEKCQFALENGADETVDYTTQDLKDTVKELTGGKGADVIYDPVGGEAFDLAARCIAWNGRLLVVGFASGTIPQYPVNLALLKGCAVVGVHYQAFVEKQQADAWQNIKELMQMVEEGKICPKIDKEFPLEHAADALNYVGSRRAIGKVVVNVCGSGKVPLPQPSQC
jgi:NADPH2:quinone reductase